MKKLDIKSVGIGFIMGTMGVVTVFAASKIKSVNFSDTHITLDGTSIPLKDSLVYIAKDDEEEKLYMPIREVFENIGYNVNWNDKTKNIDLVLKTVISDNENSNPYFVSFQELFSLDPGLNGKIKYVSLDLSDVKSKSTSDFIEQMKTWCKQNNYILLEKTHDQLVEDGFIEDWHFKEGILISYKDISLDENNLVTEAIKWRSGIGAISVEFTLKKVNNIWSIIKTEEKWMS